MIRFWFWTIGLLSLLNLACSPAKERQAINPADWSGRVVTQSLDSLIQGKTYLPVYSHIYHIENSRAYALTVTVCIRNVSALDTVFIRSGAYYNTQGDKIREYFERPIFVKPMETLEIVIEESDNEGGSGANFLFDWAMHSDKNEPLFESIMISTYGQQGLSLLSRGVRIQE